MNSSFKTLLITVTWTGFTLLWINHSRNPLDRILNGSGTKDRILQMCSSSKDCSSVRFDRLSSFFYPLQPVHCTIHVRGTGTAVADVERILDRSINGYERKFFTVTADRGASKPKGGAA
ncbi:hypothetical protein [Hydrogenophaga sp. SL48]|uniref:hypothetical protein n=1 Tax=Hydrogenophaga sp. SL48 TaxID=2806347 RepID=UPI001F16F386|nr:hypothetical protein [Hydrogenophaga sp. SL48]UJW83153.1 hypothetical protein IM738_11045 [Hydrogenophaga sp. SL48]